MALFCFSIIIYELEREVQPAEFDYGNSFWYTFATITTLGLGDYIVITTRGRFVTGFIVATGIFLDTLVVVAILENISLGEKGRLVLNFLQQQNARDRMENAAAAYIVHWWKWEAKRRAEASVPRRRSQLLRIIPLGQNLSDTPVDVIIAMKAFHHEKHRWKLLERRSEDKVLETLYSIQDGLLKNNSPAVEKIEVSFPPKSRDDQIRDLIQRHIELAEATAEIAAQLKELL